MAVPTIEAWSSTSSAVATSVDLSKPTGTVSGDLLVAFPSKEADQTYASNDGSFTLIAECSDNGGGGNNAGQCALWKQAGASEPSTWNFSFGAVSGYVMGFVAAVAGHDTTTPINAHAANAMNGSTDADVENVGGLIKTAPLTTTVADCLGLHAACTWSDSFTSGYNGTSAWSYGSNADYAGALSASLTTATTHAAESTNFTESTSWAGVGVAIAPSGGATFDGSYIYWHNGTSFVKRRLRDGGGTNQKASLRYHDGTSFKRFEV